MNAVAQSGTVTSHCAAMDPPADGHEWVELRCGNCNKKFGWIVWKIGTRVHIWCKRCKHGITYVRQ